MTNETANQIKPGDTVRAIVRCWGEDETASPDCFHTGVVDEVVQTTSFSTWLTIAGFDRLVPADRVVEVMQ